ncbi:unnamed protein product [Fusarium equiseti]|uniref:Uncharacterized protein n=1 Tax=Fusarium equiseti TaxID=61235 RepID=A0A8J2NEV7_FUSEQ|nr:unnamed protein product [Fusarium equiseti]
MCYDYDDDASQLFPGLIRRRESQLWITILVHHPFRIRRAYGSPQPCNSGVSHDGKHWLPCVIPETCFENSAGGSLHFLACRLWISSFGEVKILIAAITPDLPLFVGLHTKSIPAFTSERGSAK